MPANKAKEYYIKKRLNCAQAVAQALHEHLDLKGDAFAEHSSHGGGNAPEGWCGALYAASKALEKAGCAGKTEELMNEFLRKSGSLKCTEIRRNRKLSCVGCVEEAAKFVAQNCRKGVE